MVYVVHSLEDFRRERDIPEWVDLEVVVPPVDVLSLAEGHWIPSLFIAECGITFPPNHFFLEFCQYFDVVPAKVAPNTWRIVNGIHRLNQLHGTHIGIPELMFCYKWGITGEDTYYLKTRFANRALVVNLPDSNKDYFDYGIIAKNWQHAPLQPGEEYNGPRCPQSGQGIADNKKGCPKDKDIRLEELKFLWGIHQLVGEEHPRSPSYLLRYRSSVTSFVARPTIAVPSTVVGLEEDPVPTSSATESVGIDVAAGGTSSSFDSEIPLSASMGKRKVPNLMDEDPTPKRYASVGAKKKAEASKKSQDVEKRSQVLGTEENKPAEPHYKRMKKGPVEKQAKKNAVDQQDLIEKNSNADGSSSVPFNPSLARELIKAATLPDHRAAAAPMPRLKLSERASQSLALFLVDFNQMLEKDDQIRASSSNEVEEAFEGLRKSLDESRRALENKQKLWDDKMKIVEEAREKAVDAWAVATLASIEAEGRAKAVEDKLSLNQTSLQVAEKKIVGLAADLVAEKAKRKKTKEASFDKGWERAISATSAQIAYVKKKFFKDGWSAALKEVSTAEDSELFQRHDPGSPPNLDEEIDDDEGSWESSLAPVESVILSTDQSAAQPTGQENARR